MPRRQQMAARNDNDEDGARGGRTLTVSLPTDFKSVASADSAIAPARNILPYFEMLSNREALSSEDHVYFEMLSNLDALSRFKR